MLEPPNVEEWCFIDDEEKFEFVASELDWAGWCMGDYIGAGWYGYYPGLKSSKFVLKPPKIVFYKDYFDTIEGNKAELLKILDTLWPNDD